jgi:small subunit ribosomal protein S17
MPKRTLQGVVVSDKQDKTVVVRVERRFAHPVFGKVVRRSNKFHAHDEKNEFSVGDLVWIEEHKPISKLKHWIVTQGKKLEKTEAPLEAESEKRLSKKRSAKGEQAEAPAAAAKSETAEPSAKPAKGKRASKAKES